MNTSAPVEDPKLQHREQHPGEVKVVVGAGGVSGGKDTQSGGSRVSKKGSKKKKNQCYFEKCSSPASKFIGDCNFCKGHYCSKHRLMENHACEGLSNCKEAMHKRNADKLVSEQTKVPKIQI